MPKFLMPKPLFRSLAAGTLLAVATPALAAPPPQPSYNDRLRALTELQQRAVLRRAVIDSGMYCGRVEGASYRRPWENLQMWTVSCGRGGDYAVFVGPDGSAQARKCGEMAQLKLPACPVAAAPAKAPPAKTARKP